MTDRATCPACGRERFPARPRFADHYGDLCRGGARCEALTHQRARKVVEAWLASDSDGHSDSRRMADAVTALRRIGALLDVQDRTTGGQDDE